MDTRKLEVVIGPVIEKMAEIDLVKVVIKKPLSKRREQKRLQIQAIRRRNGWQPSKGVVISPDRY